MQCTSFLYIRFRFSLAEIKKKKKQLFDCLCHFVSLDRYTNRWERERILYNTHTHTHYSLRQITLLKIIILSVVSIQFSPDPQTKIQNNEGSIKETFSLWNYNTVVTQIPLLSKRSWKQDRHIHLYFKVWYTFKLEVEISIFSLINSLV